MKLTITITEDVGGKDISESASVILSDAKHSPELLILNKVQEVKKALIKKIDERITELLSNQPYACTLDESQAYDPNSKNIYKVEETKGEDELKYKSSFRDLLEDGEWQKFANDEHTVVLKIDRSYMDRVILTNLRGDTYTSKSEELMDFLFNNGKSLKQQ